jgi:hypothetical protein
MKIIIVPTHKIEDGGTFTFVEYLLNTQQNIKIITKNEFSFFKFFKDLYIFIYTSKTVFINCGFSPFNTFFIFLSLLFGKKLVIIPHGTYMKWGINNKKKLYKRIYSYVDIFLYKFADVVIFGSNYEKNESIWLADLRNYIVITLPFVNISNFNFHINKSIKTDNLIKKNLNCLFIGRIDKKKLLAKTIDTLLKISKHSNRNVTFYVYGPLEDLDYWKEICKYHNFIDKGGLIKIIYRGLWKWTNLPNLNDFDFSISLSESESFGLLTLELILLGVPIIYSKETIPSVKIYNLENLFIDINELESDPNLLIYKIEFFKDNWININKSIRKQIYIYNEKFDKFISNI